MSSSSASNPALHAFTADLFAIARSLELLHHAIAARDDLLAVMAAARLRAGLPRLLDASAALGDQLLEARLLSAGLDRRVRSAVAAAPLCLDGLDAILAFLDRFGRQLAARPG